MHALPQAVFASLLSTCRLMPLAAAAMVKFRHGADEINLVSNGTSEEEQPLHSALLQRATPAPSPKPTALTRSAAEGAAAANATSAVVASGTAASYEKASAPRWWPVDTITLAFTSTWLVYGVVHSVNIAGGLPVSKLEVALHGAFRTLEVAPMLCILFVGAAARANLETDGYLFALSPATLRDFRVEQMPHSMRKPDFGVYADENIAIKIAAVALLTAAVARCFGEYWEARVVESNPEDPRYVIAPAWKERTDVCAQLYNFAYIFMFIFVIVLVVSCCRQIDSDPAGFSVGTSCAMILCTLYFCVYFCYWILEDTTLIRCRFGAGVARLAVLSVNFAPIFGVLCLGLEYGGLPERRMKNKLVIATVCIAFLVLLATLTPFVMAATIRGEPDEAFAGSRDGDLVVRSGAGFLVVTVFHWIAIVVLIQDGVRLAHAIWELPECPKCLLYATMAYFHMRLLIWAIPMLVQWCYRDGPDLWMQKTRANRLVGFLKDFSKIFPMFAGYTLGWWLFAPY